MKNTIICNSPCRLIPKYGCETTANRCVFSVVHYLLLFLFGSEDNHGKRKHYNYNNYISQKHRDNNALHCIPLDAPGGASYIKFRPFLTRSSPINNLKMNKFMLSLSLLSVEISSTTFKLRNILQLFLQIKSNKHLMYVKNTYFQMNQKHTEVQDSCSLLCFTVPTCCCNYPALSDKPA